MKKPTIALIDYRMGNLHSLSQSFVRAGAEARVVTKPEDLEGVDGLVLPGVGAFGPAMRNLEAQEMIEPVLEWARADRPFFAVCVGVQLLFEESDEDGLHRGLGLVSGRVRRLPSGAKIPQMGWNTIALAPKASESVYGPSLKEGGYYYFAHSYCIAEADPSAVLATTDYGITFASVIGRGNMLGTQFHPEKSSREGLAIIESFVRVAAGGA